MLASLTPNNKNISYENNQNIPTSAENCLSIVHSLMCHLQSGESESFAKRAIESLVKKLKERHDELDALVVAVTTNGAHNTKCVTIQRTLDGRLQVAGRKGFPHVIYAKIWRWPDLHKNELKHIKSCKFPFNLKCDYVCVNPYHYQRVISPAIDLSNLNLTNFSSNISNDLNEYPSYSKNNLTIKTESNNSSNNNINSTIQHSLNLIDQTKENNHKKFKNLDTHRQVNNIAKNSTNTFGTWPTNSINSVNVQSSKSSNYSILSNNQPSSSTCIENFSNTNRLPDNNVNPLMKVNNNFWPSNKILNLHESSNPNLILTCSLTGRPLELNNFTNNNMLSAAPLPNYWCTIVYFENNQQIGNLFKVSSYFNYVIVDGYVDPVGRNRFCLGALSNIHRTEKSKKVRLHIGKGIQLDLIGEGDVWLRCLSNNPVFVQSYYLDREAGRAPGDAVHKIYPSAYIKIFDLKHTYIQMQQQLESIKIDVAAQAAAVVGHISSSIPMNNIESEIRFSKSAGIGIDDLRRLCILRLSFVKGWGHDYPRKTIKETPCWIEIYMNRSLQLLDELLHNT